MFYGVDIKKVRVANIKRGRMVWEEDGEYGGGLGYR